MKAPSVKTVRCAIYTRVSTEHGLDQEFNSLDAQYDAASAYIKSQAHAGWTLIRSRYDDGGYSAGSTDRPDLQKLLEDIRGRKIDVIVVYEVDRLTRSLADFAKLVGGNPNDLRGPPKGYSSWAIIGATCNRRAEATRQHATSCLFLNWSCAVARPRLASAANAIRLVWQPQ